MTERRPAVSVIVPVYNTAPYLARCLDSLVRQTMSNIEVVVVDDGSSDGSLGISEEYARRDPRVRVVRHDKNEGLHQARVTGVLASCADYIGYVDSDDYALPDAFDTFYQTAIAQDADVVRLGAHVRYDGPGESDNRNFDLCFEERVYPGGIEFLNAAFYPSMWLYVHHRRLWRTAMPHIPSGRFIGEDNLTAFLLAFFANKVVSRSAVAYVYSERDDSLSGDRSLPSVMRHIEDRARIVQVLQEFVTRTGNVTLDAWRSVRDSNRGLVVDYIASLSNVAQRATAAAAFEQWWGEPLALDDPCSS